MSKQWENDLAREIWHADPPYVRAYRAGYSGSGAMPQPDVLVHDNSTGMAYAIESKGPIKNDQVAIDDDDADQMEACRSHMTQSWLVVKFRNRAPINIPLLETDGYDDRTPLEQLQFIIQESYPFLNARIPGEKYLYIDKPSLDDWESARASEDDYREILRGIGVFKDE